MMTSEDLIFSGLLELYVFGDVNPEEVLLVEEMAKKYEEVRYEIEQIEKALEVYAFNHAVEPDPIAKPFLLATIDYMDRMKAGEDFTSPPLLNIESKASDFEPWLSRPDMKAPKELGNIYAKILSYTEQIITAIVWIKDIAPQETHDSEYERFLILEGSCDIIIEGRAHTLLPGDFFSIPLHKSHQVKVTSTVLCKVILQRVAA